MIRRIGGHTLGFEEMPSIIGYASVVGRKRAKVLSAKALTRLFMTAITVRTPMNRRKAHCNLPL